MSPKGTVVCCQACISASKDPRRGSGKKNKVFFAHVFSKYLSITLKVKEKILHGRYFDCTGDGILQRYLKARCEFLKLKGILSSIKSKIPTGTPSDADIERAVVSIYNCEAIIGDMYSFLRDPEQNYGPDIDFLDVLRYFRTTHVWDMLLKSSEGRRKHAVERKKGPGETEYAISSMADSAEQPSPQSPSLDDTPDCPKPRFQLGSCYGTSSWCKACT